MKMSTSIPKKTKHSVTGTRTNERCPNCGQDIHVKTITDGAFRVWCPDCARTPEDGASVTEALWLFMDQK